MFAFVVFCLVFSTKPRDWLGRTILKWPILCWVGCKALTQSAHFSGSSIIIKLTKENYIVIREGWEMLRCALYSLVCYQLID